MIELRWLVKTIGEGGETIQVDKRLQYRSEHNMFGDEEWKDVPTEIIEQAED